MPVNSHVVRQCKSFLIHILLLGVSPLSSPEQAEQLFLVENKGFLCSVLFVIFTVISVLKESYFVGASPPAK